MSGEALYEFAQQRSELRGLSMNLKSKGHRLGDFPHHLIHKGSLLECKEEIVQHAWILEIHLVREGKYGAFFEDILTK